MCLKDLRDEFIYDCECRHLAKGSVRRTMRGGAELLCDGKTKATNFLQLIALGIVNYSVFEITSLVAAIFRSL